MPLEKFQSSSEISREGAWTGYEFADEISLVISLSIIFKTGRILRRLSCEMTCHAIMFESAPTENFVIKSRLISVFKDFYAHFQLSWYTYTFL